MRNVLRLLRYGLPYTLEWLPGVILSALVGGLEAFRVLLLQPIFDQVKDKGPGGHILTGPVAIAEAEPGDVLEVDILKIDIDAPFACNGFAVGRGTGTACNRRKCALSGFSGIQPAQLKLPNWNPPEPKRSPK